MSRNRAPRPIVLVTRSPRGGELAELVRKRHAVALCAELDDLVNLARSVSALAYIFDADELADLALLKDAIASLPRQNQQALVLTSRRDEASLQAIFEAGAADLLLKPLCQAELAARLDRLLTRNRTRVSAAIPRRIGPYVLQEPIGRGGTSAVFLAHHFERPDRKLALKVIWPHLTTDPEVIQRFRREIHVLQGLEHPHLVRLVASGRHKEWFYYVMEHLPGGTLRARILERAASPLEVAEFLCTIADPLAYIHERELIHRDIKPENIYFNGSRLVLGDFGLAKLLYDQSITLEDDVLGTPLYLAPEALRGHTSDGRADIYAVGVCALEWLNGGPIVSPDPGEGVLSLIGRLCREGLPDPKNLIPDLPEDMARLLRRCVASEAAARFSSAAELGAAARELLASLQKDKAASGEPEGQSSP